MAARPECAPRSLAAVAAWYVAALAGACVFAIVPLVHAQSSDPAAAEALFEKGREALARDDFQTACAAFGESNRLDPSDGTVGNLAICEERRGHLATAWQWFEQLAAKLPAGDPRREIAVQHAAALKPRIPALTIALAADAPVGTRVTRDSVELRAASLGTPLPVDPGAHRVVVSAPGRADRRYAIELRERETKEFVVEPGSAAESAAATGAGAQAHGAPSSPGAIGRESTATHSSGARTAGYIVGGVGVAGIGTALVLGGIALGKKSTVQGECDLKTRLCNTQNGPDAASAGHTLATASTISFVIGAVATGVGAYLVLSSPSEKGPAVSAAALPGGAFVNVTRRF
jgi:hypothetical protein